MPTQRLLRDDVSALDEDLLVIAEEFGNWEDAPPASTCWPWTKAGRLVVIELKSPLLVSRRLFDSIGLQRFPDSGGKLRRPVG